MNIIETWIDGKQVYSGGKVLFSYEEPKDINKFICSEIKEEDILVHADGESMRVIEAIDMELLTRESIVPVPRAKYISADPDNNILKIIVKDRYFDSPPSVGFISNFGLKKGAFASSVAHDSHNIICVGADDKDIVAAVNELVRLKGGLAVSSEGKVSSLQLKIAGIMSEKPVNEVAKSYESLSHLVIAWVHTLSSFHDSFLHGPAGHSRAQDQRQRPVRWQEFPARSIIFITILTHTVIRCSFCPLSTFTLLLFTLSPLFPWPLAP
jgi:adenine deaminase